MSHENSIKAALPRALKPGENYAPDRAVTAEEVRTRCLPAPTHTSGNSQLLMDYRAALIKAYDLGEDIKILYGIVPPKVLHDKSWPQLDSNYPANHFTIGLTVS